MFCISSLDKNERSRATRSTRGGHLWRRLYFKIRGFKIDKTGRVGNKGESVAAVQRRWLTVVIVPLLIIQARGAMISRFFTRCNRNRLKNREGGGGKKRKEREICGEEYENTSEREEWKRMWRWKDRGSLYFALMAP